MGEMAGRLEGGIMGKVKRERGEGGWWKAVGQGKRENRRVADTQDSMGGIRKCC